MAVKMKICFFHLFKCGGTTFNWILQNNFPDHVLYAEKPDRCRGRLKASSVEDHLRQAGAHGYQVLSSHLAEPACAQLAQFPCSIVRIPMDRNWSAYKFQIHQGSTDSSFPYAQYLERHHDFQVRVLGGEDSQEDRVQSILQTFNLGILERFDESMVVFEWLLLQQGISVNFAYPGRKNKSKTSQQNVENMSKEIDNALKMNCFLKDLELYRAASGLLDERIAAIPDMDQRLRDFQQRCDQAQHREERTPLKGYGKGPSDFTYLEPSTVPGLRPGFG